MCPVIDIEDGILFCVKVCLVLFCLNCYSTLSFAVGLNFILRSTQEECDLVS